MKSIQQQLSDLMEESQFHPNRTRFNTVSEFARMQKFDMRRGFPVQTVKPFPFKTMLRETLWFLKGTDSCDFLDEKGVKIWKIWTHPELNSVGKMYGSQLRRYESYKTVKLENLPYYQSIGYTPTGTYRDNKNRFTANPEQAKTALVFKEIDPLQNIVDSLIENPYSRRHVISLWNPSFVPDESKSPIDNVALDNGALANCHGTVIQFAAENLSLQEILKIHDAETLENYFAHEGISFNHPLPDDVFSRYPHTEYFDKWGITVLGLNLAMYQRSADIPTAAWFNISQYSLLLHIVAHICRMKPLIYTHITGDAHIYENQTEYVREILSRPPMPLPTLHIKRDISLDDVNEEDFELSGYQSHPPIDIRFEVAE